MPTAALTDIIRYAIAGDLIAFPTDTVPGLAVRPDQAAAIYATKQRETTKPLILMAATAMDLWPYVTGNAAAQSHWQAVGDRYWPGALTLVLPASEQVPPAVNPHSTGTIGLRVPNHPIARYILAQTGPLATTSINRSGEPPLTTPASILAAFPQLWVVDPAEPFTTATQTDTTWASSWLPPSVGQPSTVAQWIDSGDWHILRAGAIVIESP